MYLSRPASTYHVRSNCPNTLSNGSIQSRKPIHLAIPDHLRSIGIDNPLGNNAISTQPRPNLGPTQPIRSADQKHAPSHDGEDVVGVTLGVPVRVGRDEGHDGEEHVAEDEEDGDGEVGVPRGRPVFGFLVMEP